MDGRPNGKRPGRGKGKKGKMGIKDKMIVMAHCAHANKGDKTRQVDCKKCFMNAVKPSRNPRARVNAKEAILTAVTGCSEEFLAPVYDKCTTMLKDKLVRRKECMSATSDYLSLNWFKLAPMESLRQQQKPWTLSWTVARTRSRRSS